MLMLNSGISEKNNARKVRDPQNCVFFFIKNSKLPWWNAITCAVTLWKKKTTGYKYRVKLTSQKSG